MQDIAAYNVKQVSGDHNNLVSVLMKDKDLSVQPAIITARKCLQESIERFLKFEKLVPSWDASIDEEVQMYVQGLRDCIVGVLHWVYETERYFQGHGDDIRSFGWIFLLSQDDDQSSM